MPLGKDDNPKADNPKADKPDVILGPSDPKTKAAVQDITDAGAGAPEAQMEEAEALPEKDDVQKGVKEAMLADTGKEEAQAKVKVVKASPDSPDTPSGAALLKTAGIANNVERGEAYAREKSSKRWGYVTPDLKKKDEGK